MIKGLAITPPILGRISIGKVVEKNGKRLPEKDDQFTITSQIQGKEGWVKHPLDEQLRAKTTQHSTAAQAAIIAQKAGVGQLIIGHFSARYSNKNGLLTPSV